MAGIAQLLVGHPLHRPFAEKNLPQLCSVNLLANSSPGGDVIIRSQDNVAKDLAPPVVDSDLKYHKHLSSLCATSSLSQTSG